MVGLLTGTHSPPTPPFPPDNDPRAISLRGESISLERRLENPPPRPCTPIRQDKPTPSGAKATQLQKAAAAATTSSPAAAQPASLSRNDTDGVGLLSSLSFPLRCSSLLVSPEEKRKKATFQVRGRWLYSRRSAVVGCVKRDGRTTTVEQQCSS